MCLPLGCVQTVDPERLKEDAARSGEAYEEDEDEGMGTQRTQTHTHPDRLTEMVCLVLFLCVCVCSGGPRVQCRQQ